MFKVSSALHPYTLRNAICGILLSLVILPLQGQSEEEAYEVLFLGNSFTARVRTHQNYSVPRTFEALAIAGGHPAPVVEYRIEGGENYKFHFQDTTSQDKIAERDWTHVVLQNQSREPTHIGSITNHLTYGPLLYESVMANNEATQVILYETWAYAHSYKKYITGTSTNSTFESTAEMQSELQTNYAALADAINASITSDDRLPVKISPVGQAWYSAGANFPSNHPDFLNLFVGDHYHPNDLGYYLSACVHYANIYHSNPVGLHLDPAVQALGLRMSNEDAAFVEQIAWNTIMDIIPDDVTSPEIVEHQADPTGQIRIQFTEPVAEETVLDPSQYFIANQGRKLRVSEVALEFYNRRILLTPEADLAGNYVVSIPETITDLAGNPLSFDEPLVGFIPTLSDNQIYIDLGRTDTFTPHDGVATWNNLDSTIGFSADGKLENLLATNGTETNIHLEMISPFGHIGNVGTTASTTLPISSVTQGTLFGHVGSYDGKSNIIPQFKLTGLDPAKVYTLAFYASRLDSSNNRETQYNVSGETSGSATLNPSVNVDDFAVISNLQPTTTGELEILLTPGPNNSTNAKYTYLGALLISLQSEAETPVLYPPVFLERVGIVVDWKGEGSLRVTNDLTTPWLPLDPSPEAPYIEEPSESPSRFYSLAFEEVE